LTGWQAVETYKFAIQKCSGKSLSESRKEYMEKFKLEKLSNGETTECVERK